MIKIKKKGIDRHHNKKNDMELKLPYDTRVCLASHCRIDNYFLKLNKASFWHQEEAVLYKTDRGRLIYDASYKFEEKDIKFIAGRQKDLIAKSGLLTKSFELRSAWRLAVGLGNHSVYETAITLHHIYGIPYIPGSAVKGVTRSWIIANYFNDCEGNGKHGALGDMDFCRMFGSPKKSVLGEHRGAVVFFDAYPVTPPIIDTDVMNSHFSDYYAKSKPPADYLNPIPVFFMTVKNTKFLFAVGVSSSGNEDVSVGGHSGKTLDVAGALLADALQKHGIGAKTAVGYGIMSE